MSENIQLDIILPCYNPTKGWEKGLTNSLGMLNSLLPSLVYRVILVNDGSSKGISDIHIDYLKRELPHFQYISYNENMGKGFALRKGVAYSTAPHCIYTDIDFPYTENSLVDVYNHLTENNCDLAIGTRQADYYDRVPTYRIWISKLLKFVIRLSLQIPTSDTQAGLKGFNNAGKSIFLNTKINRYLFDLEFIYLAAKDNKNLVLELVPIVVKKDVVFSSMNWKVLFIESFNFFKILGR